MLRNTVHSPPLPHVRNFDKKPPKWFNHSPFYTWPKWIQECPKCLHKCDVTWGCLSKCVHLQRAKLLLVQEDDDDDCSPMRPTRALCTSTICCVFMCMMISPRASSGLVSRPLADLSLSPCITPRTARWSIRARREQRRGGRIERQPWQSRRGLFFSAF